jgi:flagellar capping protein FliD
MLCRYVKDSAQRKRAHDKREIKRHMAKKPVIYDRFCTVCEREFRTKIKNKEFCTKRCCQRIKTFPVQIDNVEDNLVKIEERIVNINLRYEKKMNALEDQLDYMNFELEKQRLKYQTKFEFLKKVMNK